MYQVTILPDGSKISVKEGGNLRSELIAAGIEIKSTCGGCASCGTCVIKVSAGEENLSEISFEEKQLLGNVFHMTRERLSCQTLVNGDMTIDISAHIVEKKQPKVIRKTKDAIALSAEEERNTEKPIKEGGWKKPKSFRFDNEE